MQHLEKDNLEITRQTKGSLPDLPFVEAKNLILGKAYNLSLAFVDIKQMKELSKTHKGNENHLNTLAFPLDTKSGEIIMNLQTIRSQAKDYGKTYRELLLFFFVHSSLHLKGFKHGTVMEELEEKYLKKLQTSVKGRKK